MSGRYASNDFRDRTGNRSYAEHEVSERVIDDTSDDLDAPSSRDRRGAERVDVTWSVDCEIEDTFLYASIANISELGIFVRTTEPLEVGTRLTLRFSPPNLPEPFVLAGVVQWVNPIRALAPSPNPGMGISFVALTPEDRERIVGVIRTIAYVRDNAPN